MNQDRLFYFSRSADRPVGSGTNEHVNDVNKYIILNSITDWRKKLSNFWISPFKYDGVHWNTVEHMFQAYKIKIVDPLLSYEFCLESNSDLSRGNGSEAQKKRKLVMLNKEQLQYWESIKHEVMYRALLARFSQCEDSRQVLLSTGDAELWHGTRGVKPSRQVVLEKVRNEVKLR